MSNFKLSAPDDYGRALSEFIAEAEALDVVVIPAALANVSIGLRSLRFLLALCNAGGPAFTLCGEPIALDTRLCRICRKRRMLRPNAR